jgi:hypothetical protein
MPQPRLQGQQIHAAAFHPRDQKCGSVTVQTHHLEDARAGRNEISFVLADFRSGSDAEVAGGTALARFYLNSRHGGVRCRYPKSATTELMHRSNAVSFDHLVGAGPKASLPRALAVIGFGLRYAMMRDQRSSHRSRTPRREAAAFRQALACQSAFKYCRPNDSSAGKSVEKARPSGLRQTRDGKVGE